jgi:hypothetical protein
MCVWVCVLLESLALLSQSCVLLSTSVIVPSERIQERHKNILKNDTKVY